MNSYAGESKASCLVEQTSALKNFITNHKSDVCEMDVNSESEDDGENFLPLVILFIVYIAINYTARILKYINIFLKTKRKIQKSYLEFFFLF